MASRKSADANQHHEFGYKLGEMARAWRGQFEGALKTFDLTFVQWSTLTQLAGSDDTLVQKELALRVGIDTPTMVGVLDRLVKNALIERRVSVHDRRANTVHLTTAGRTLLKQCERELRKVRARLLEDFSPEELTEGISLFERVSAKARSW